MLKSISPRNGLFALDPEELRVSPWDRFWCFGWDCKLGIPEDHRNHVLFGR